MTQEIHSTIDPGMAALFGAAIGAGASVIVQIIGAFVTSEHEVKRFQREIIKQQVVTLSETYELALNIIYNMKRNGNPDRSTRGSVFAQISLVGSPAVISLVNEFLEINSESQKKFDLNQLVKAMKEHISEVENGA